MLSASNFDIGSNIKVTKSREHGLMSLRIKQNENDIFISLPNNKGFLITIVR